MSTLRNEKYIMSTLHNFIDDNCTREMIAIDVDLFMIKFNRDTIRFIECKRIDEPTGNGQMRALEILSQMSHPVYKVKSFIVTGNYPYKTATIREIGGKSAKVDQKTLIQWLNFEIEMC